MGAGLLVAPSADVDSGRAASVCVCACVHLCMLLKLLKAPHPPRCPPPYSFGLRTPCPSSLPPPPHPTPPSARPCRTPLAAGVVGNVLHLGLLLGLVFGLGWGVAGAGLATSLSHWAALAYLMANVLGKGYMR